jgi:hypothetical protein
LKDYLWFLTAIDGFFVVLTANDGFFAILTAIDGFSAREVEKCPRQG